MRDIFPEVKNDVRFKEVNSHFFLLYGEEKLEINHTGYEIVKLLDGSKSPQIIKEILVIKYLEDWEKVSQWVDDFLFELWRKRVFLEDNIEVGMSNNYLRVDRYTVIRGNIDSKDLKITYCSSIINPDSLKNTLFITILEYNSNNDISGAYSLYNLGNEGVRLWQLFAIYGESNMSNLNSVVFKKALINYINQIEEIELQMTEAIEIVFLDTLENERNHFYNGKKYIGTLRNEIGNKDLVISSLCI